MKVIIADDSQTIRRVVSGMLEEMEGEFECLMADGGDIVLQHLGEHHDVDLILLDWNMNVMNGLDCLRAIRAREDSKNIPVMMITAESEKERVAEAIESGATGYLTKPFTSERFQEVIAPILASRG